MPRINLGSLQGKEPSANEIGKMSKKFQEYCMEEGGYNTSEISEDEMFDTSPIVVSGSIDYDIACHIDYQLTMIKELK